VVCIHLLEVEGVESNSTSATLNILCIGIFKIYIYLVRLWWFTWHLVFQARGMVGLGRAPGFSEAHARGVRGLPVSRGSRAGWEGTHCHRLGLPGFVSGCRFSLLLGRFTCFLQFFPRVDNLCTGSPGFFWFRKTDENYG
jgi:hypothetical protein